MLSRWRASVAWMFFAVLLNAILAAGQTEAQNNPVPQIVGPVHPDAVAPGRGAFTLSVYGANFVPGAVVNWNYQPRVTTYVSGHEIQAQVLPSDVETSTAGYITVINPPPGGGSSSASWAQVEVHAPVSTISLSEPAFYDFGAWSLQEADFTHGGILDLVGENDGLSFEQGVGNGTFQAGSVVNPRWVQTTPFVYGDFDNDGNLDIAADTGDQPPYDPLQMSISFGNGEGGFSPGSTFRENGGLGVPVVGDFNRDGNLDLITSGLYAMAEFLGNGDGTFQHFANYGYKSIAKAMQVGDFNGDGKLDVVMMGPLVYGFAQTIWIMLGNGDGTFQKPYQILSLTGSSTNGCGFTSQLTLQVSDFNNDGNLDIAFCAKEGLGIMLGNGDGTFKSPTYFYINNNVGDFSFAIGDINSDGNQDLLVYEYLPNSTTYPFVAYLGSGDGTFQPPQILQANAGPLAELGVVLGDFNNDGLLDSIFLSDLGMYVLIQQ